MDMFKSTKTICPYKYVNNKNTSSKIETTKHAKIQFN